MMNDEIRADFERLECKIDVIILMGTGLTREQAEERVYWPRIVRLVDEVHTISQKMVTTAKRMTLE